MLKEEILVKEEELFDQFKKQGNYKNQLLKRLQKEGQSLVYAKNQCACIMNDGTTDYGVVVVVKTRPGHSLKYDRLEHGIDQRHLEWLIDKVPYIQIWLYEKQSGKLLMAYYHKLSRRLHDVKGFPVEYAPRAEFYDATLYLKGKIALSELPKPEL